MAEIVQVKESAVQISARTEDIAAKMDIELGKIYAETSEVASASLFLRWAISYLNRRRLLRQKSANRSNTYTIN